MLARDTASGACTTPWDPSSTNCARQTTFTQQVVAAKTVPGSVPASVASATKICFRATGIWNLTRLIYWASCWERLTWNQLINIITGRCEEIALAVLSLKITSLYVLSIALDHWIVPYGIPAFFLQTMDLPLQASSSICYVRFSWLNTSGQLNIIFTLIVMPNDISKPLLPTPILIMPSINKIEIYSDNRSPMHTTHNYNINKELPHKAGFVFDNHPDLAHSSRRLHFHLTPTPKHHWKHSAI